MTQHFLPVKFSLFKTIILTNHEKNEERKLKKKKINVLEEKRFANGFHSNSKKDFYS